MSVFANDVATPDGPKSMRRVSVQRVYKDKEGEFKYTATLKTNDIPKAILGLMKAFDYLTNHEEQKSNAQPEVTQGRPG